MGVPMHSISLPLSVINVALLLLLFTTLRKVNVFCTVVAGCSFLSAAIQDQFRHGLVWMSIGLLSLLFVRVRHA